MGIAGILVGFLMTSEKVQDLNLQLPYIARYKMIQLLATQILSKCEETIWGLSC